MTVSLRVALLALIIIILAGCNPKVINQKNMEKFDYIVATADNNYSYSMPQLYETLYKSSFLKKGGVLDTSQIRYFLDSIIVDSLVGFDADTIDLTTNYGKWRTYKIRYNRKIMKEYFKQVVDAKVDLDSTLIIEYYNDNPDIFTAPEQIDLFQIFIAVNDLLYGLDSLKYKYLTEEEFEKAAMEYAFSIRNQVNSKESFMEAARKYSNDVFSANMGGYVGLTGRKEYIHPFDSIAFLLRDGDISDPYRDKDGWHILFCDKYYSQGVRPLNENLYKVVKEKYFKEKVNAIGDKLLDSLFSEIQVEYNDSLLSSNIFTIDGINWLAVISGVDTIDVNEARPFEMKYRKQSGLDNTSAEIKRIYLKELGKKYKIVQAARNIKIDSLPELVSFSNVLIHKYCRAIIENERYDPYWAPDDSLIELYYNEHLDEFLSDKPLVVQHIIVEDSLFGIFLRDQALSGIDFLELAKEYYPGEESIRMDLANLGEISDQDVPQEFYQAAIQTMPGNISYPVKTEFGYHIIKVIEKRENMRLDRARVDIIPILKKLHRKETFEKYKENIFQRYHVQMPGKLYSVHLKPKNLRK